MHHTYIHDHVTAQVNEWLLIFLQSKVNEWFMLFHHHHMHELKGESIRMKPSFILANMSGNQYKNIFFTVHSTDHLSFFCHWTQRKTLFWVSAVSHWHPWYAARMRRKVKRSCTDIRKISCTWQCVNYQKRPFFPASEAYIKLQW